MTRLPQHSVAPGASFQGLTVDDHLPAASPTIPQANGPEIEGKHANGGQSYTIFRDSAPQDRPVGATVETELALNSIDGVSRINVNEAQAQFGEVRAGSELAWLNGPTLAENLLSFVTPRLRDSGILRPEKHGLLLERLADALSTMPEAPASREGIAILQRELRQLILLRQNKNGLIKG
ncbi:hypothetical protein [Bradyrhizobium sp. Cp5.3]|uniref:type III secretion apparatus assembly protein SctX n=1 Tax=Bradyrhizobium sp. Cp5.3 TaxID=443598 RepID=UPI00040BF093|nr:hypothetical protein [Bradyrhizobium sp. Cp5.3]